MDLASQAPVRASRAPPGAAVPEPRRWTIGEDWMAVVIGAVLIGVVLGGVRPGAPHFAWTAAGDLTGTVLGGGSVLRSVHVGLLLLAP
jgi:hypothetical protein